MTNTAMEKITDTLKAKIIMVLEDHYEHDADKSAECAFDLKNLFHSQLKQIREEIEKKIGSENSTRTIKGLSKAISIINSHMEEKEQEEKE